MRIVSFETNPTLSEACVAFRYRLYGNDLLRIPPFRRQLMWYYDPSFPFYQSAGNHHRHFVAVSDDTVRGHVSAFVNADLCQIHGPDVGLVGLFECGDEAAGASLLQAAVNWLRQDHGIRRVWGPMNFDIWHEHRFKTAGFEKPPYFGEPYNPAAYDRIFQAASFAPVQTWMSVAANGPESIRQIMALHFEPAAEVTAAGYQLETLNPRDQSHLASLHSVQMAALQHGFAYTSLPLALYRQLFVAYARLVDTRFVTILRSPEGRTAGVAIAYPDPAAAVRAMQGETSLRARVAYLVRRHRTDRVIFHFVGTMPAERARQHGLGRALVHQTLRRVVDGGYRRVIFALIASDSDGRPMVGDVIRQVHGAYALYERIL